MTLIREFEGWSSVPYLCPAGVPTIAWGFTRYPGGVRVTMTDPPITQADADEILRMIVASEESKVRELAPGVDGPRLGALIDFTYNLGTGAFRNSTLRKCVQADDWDGAREQLGRWVYAAGRPLPGLIRRRAAEVKLIRGTL